MKREGLFGSRVLGSGVHGRRIYAQGLAVVVVHVWGGSRAVSVFRAYEGGFFEGPLLELG